MNVKTTLPRIRAVDRVGEHAVVVPYFRQVMQATGLTSQDDRIIDLIRPTAPLYRESSIAAALDVLRQTNADLVPIVDGSMLIGVLWASDARKALLENVSMSAPLAPFIDTAPPMMSSVT